MKKLLAATLATVTLNMSCKLESRLEETQRESQQIEIIYIRDRGLCFAFTHNSAGENGQYVGLAYVPCELMPGEAER